MSGISVQGLAKRFGSRTAVQGLSFDVRPGEVFGLLGPNGAGKTTTVRMLTGLLQPSEGEAHVWGHSVRTQGEPCAARWACSPNSPASTSGSARATTCASS
ncbi:ATP-binding cassette domain-containing protein [Cystobacter fuscus]